MSANTKIRQCATMEVYNRQVEALPSFRRAQAAIENDLNFLLEKSSSFRVNKPIKINVVVHVIYSTEIENITDAQVLSQIAVLNQDYRASNPDKVKVPEVWTSVVADPNIEFVLVTKDPNNQDTTGITRTPTSKAEFGTDDSVKDRDQGGQTPWATDTYLNIWVCNLGASILGYAQFPGGPQETDGVVIDYRAFGTEGTAAAPFNLGRTATHEIGHYLNLSHIFGDGRGSSCSDTDNVEDTPNQLGPNYQKPVFPSISCNNAPYGDMFVNYMDYVDDDCMFMFTDGQAQRMNATLSGPRASLARTTIESGENV